MSEFTKGIKEGWSIIVQIGTMFSVLAGLALIFDSTQRKKRIARVREVFHI